MRQTQRSPEGPRHLHRIPRLSEAPWQVDDSCSAFVSEDDSETQSLSSFSSGPTSPSEMPEQFPAAVRPASLDLPSPVSLSEFGVLFPGLGPRSECSGASSPECEVERGECSPLPLGWGEAGTPGWMLQSGPL